MRVTWSREASENLAEIEVFIARDSLERAVRFVDALIDHARQFWQITREAEGSCRK